MPSSNFTPTGLAVAAVGLVGRIVLDAHSPIALREGVPNAQDKSLKWLVLPVVLEVSHEMRNVRH